MSTLKTVSLNISERVAALKILNDFKGPLETLAVVIEDIKQLPVTDEEWTKADRVVTKSGEKGKENIQWTWDDEKGDVKEITLQQASLDYLKTNIEERNKKGEFTLQDKAYITLKAKVE